MSCLQLAVKWSSLTVIMPADCRYTLQGVTRMKDDYSFPVSFARQQLPFYDSTGTCTSYTHMANTSSYSSNYPSWYFDYAVEYSETRNINPSWTNFTKTWIGDSNYITTAGLPSSDAYNTGSNRREFRPANYTVTKTGPSTFTLTDPGLRCELAYRITSGSFLGLAPTPCKAGADADCPASCPSGSAKQQQQPASAGFVCALCPAAGKGSDLQSWKVGVSCGSTSAPTAAAGTAKSAGRSSPGNRRSLTAAAQAGSGTAKARTKSSADACGGAFKTPSGTSKPLFGSGILVADSSDLSQPVCKSNKPFAGFAAWLAGKKTWFSHQDGEVAWRVLGGTKDSQLAKLPVWGCAGTVLGGTHAPPEALAGRGEQLGELVEVYQQHMLLIVYNNILLGSWPGGCACNVLWFAA
jgi:hypothetical protein